jgi:hypothetical protein
LLVVASELAAGIGGALLHLLGLTEAVATSATALGR